MKWHRIWAMATRHLIQFPTDFNKLASVFYWPIIDIVLFGFTATWLDSETEGLVENKFILLTGVVLWQIVTRAGYGISLNLLEEIWSQNLTNLFSTPLSIGEWIMSSIVEGLIMLTIVTLFCFGITYIMYGYNIFELRLYFLPFVGLIFLSGLSIGFIAGGMLITWGTRVQTIAWMIGWLFAPISGAYYPIDVLPNWLQMIAKVYPLHYIFSSIREVLTTNTFPVRMFLYAVILTLFYAVATWTVFVVLFKRSRQSGLSRLST